MSEDPGEGALLAKFRTIANFGQEERVERRQNAERKSAALVGGNAVEKKTKLMNFLTTPSRHARLMRAATQQNVSMTQIIERGIDLYLAGLE
jgi:predicted HicB family RNase H-like nuclease